MLAFKSRKINTDVTIITSTMSIRPNTTRVHHQDRSDFRHHYKDVKISRSAATAITAAEPAIATPITLYRNGLPPTCFFLPL